MLRSSMVFPAFPDWLPWWVPILVLVPALLYVLAFVAMPFAVFGVKGRLEAVEARLDEIQGEIRTLALRMPEPVHHARYDDAIYAPPPTALARSRAEPVMSRPPIPPAPHLPEREGDAARASGRAARAEPRLDWPR